MLINTKAYVGSPEGSAVTIVQDENGTLSILSSATLVAGTELYSEEGVLLAVLAEEVVSDMATFYESRTEAQVLTEDAASSTYDFGWRVKSLGWMVDYVDGTALFGGLTAVNQNRQNVGIEGPTNTAGTNGSPSGLFQRVNVVARPAQVNGWKSYDSPGAYVVDPADIQLLDSTFIYADAFVSWTADSSTVTAPGSDMNALEEYSPTNSVVFTDFT